MPARSVPSRMRDTWRQVDLLDESGSFATLTAMRRAQGRTRDIGTRPSTSILQRRRRVACSIGLSVLARTSCSTEKAERQFNFA